MIAGVGQAIGALGMGVMAFKYFTRKTPLGVETSPGVWEQQMRPDDSWIIFATAAALMLSMGIYTFCRGLKILGNRAANAAIPP